MDVQAAPPTYTPVGGSPSPMGVPPVLGPQVPGTAGGLPAQGGLSVLANPLAQQLQSFGRGDDTMLVHMTPNEVNSLQGLAMASGGSLTINPHTGLPEAGWLGKLLPTLLGGVLAATGVGAPLAAGIVGLGQTAITGDLQKGLMAGLGAFGGASLAGAAGLGGSLSKNAFGVLGDKAGIFGANMGAGAAAAPGAVPPPVTTPTTPPPVDAALQGIPEVALPGGGMMGTEVAANVGQQAAQEGGKGFFGKFGETARRGLPSGILSKSAPMMAGLGVLNAVSEATTPTGGYTTSSGKIDNSYQGPYTAQKRRVIATPTTEELKTTSGERRWFDVSQPEIYDMQGRVVQPGTNTAPGTMIYQNALNPKAKKGEPMYSQIGRPYMGGALPMQSGRPGRIDPRTGMLVFEEDVSLYAKGGEVELADGAFVIDARTVSELGNGSSNAGQELLARMGGRPIKGPGDGVSDSIPARIGRDQPARVARDEVLFSPEAVRRIGKGNEKRGAQKLYALMDKAHKARKKSSRGKDTKLRRGLV